MKIPIPDEATEAAAKMIAGIEQTDWDRWEDIAEQALRAAAPYMLPTRNELADILKSTGMPAGESYAGADAILEWKGRTAS